MDAVGIDKAVLYPTLGLCHGLIQEAEFQHMGLNMTVENFEAEPGLRRAVNRRAQPNSSASRRWDESSAADRDALHQHRLGE
jgi:hypothetical protein